MSLIKSILSPRISLLLIFLFLILDLVIQIYGDGDVYKYGHGISSILVKVAFAWSFLYPLLYWLIKRKTFRKNLVWIIIGFVPALYFIILSMLSK